jgi:PAS domain S-box-containing protein
MGVSAQAGSGSPGGGESSAYARPTQHLSESRYRALFDAIDEGFCIIEVLFDDSQKPVDYRFLEANPALERLTGLIDVGGKSMRELAPDHESYWFDLYGRVALTGEPVRCERQAAALDGRWFDVYAFRVDAPGDHHVAVLFSDVTDRRRTELALRQNEERLSQAAAALRDADRRKDEFLATLAHELRNPLAPIRNGVQILRLLVKGNATLQKTTEMIERQMHHLVRLVDDLLDVSRITRGKIQLRREAVVLNDVIRSALESSETLFTSREQRVHVSIAAEPLAVVGDRDRLTQVFSNLLSNAAKFTPRGGDVWVELESKGGDAVVKVRDTGIGIPQERLQSVFEMFSQAHSAHGNDGLGIGLALVRQLVVLHGGTVVARSDGPGAGSSFEVSLPLATAA